MVTYTSINFAATSENYFVGREPQFLRGPFKDKYGKENYRKHGV